jgi:hypothetical protein
MRKTKEKLELECVLTDPEMLAYSKKLSEHLNNKNRIEYEVKAAVANGKAKIAEHDDAINEMADKLRTGKERRPVGCKIVYDWDKKTREWIRSDTGEVAHSDTIQEEDLQEHFKMMEEPGDAGQSKNL